MVKFKYFEKEEFIKLGGESHYDEAIREYRVVKFLIAMFIILRENVEKYKNEGVYKHFCELFLRLDGIPQAQQASGVLEGIPNPWRRMLAESLNAINRKCKFAKSQIKKVKSLDDKNALEKRVAQINKLIGILKETQKEADKFFVEKAETKIEAPSLPL